MMDIARQVDLACRNRTGVAPVAGTNEGMIYALGWIVANAIVSGRYHDSAIDALPVYHPEHGWDRFLLTRRVTCQYCADEPADAFGLIMLDGDDPPRLTHPNGETRLALGHRLHTDPQGAIARVLDLLPPTGLVAGDHTACWHARAARYPTLYAVVTEIICEHPALTAAREVLIDTEQIDGAFHPLYAHTAVRSAQIAYDWFELETSGFAAYFRIHGEQAVYLTDEARWSTVVKPLAEEEPDGMKQRILAWLRQRGQPDPAVD